MDIRRRNLMGQMPITANVTIENVKGSWGESSKTISGYNVYESKSSCNVNNGYDLAKVTFSGYPEFTFLYGSYGESSYDFVVISPLDYVNAQNWTNSSYSGSLLSTSGKQSSSAPNLSYTFTNDGGEHFFYILYRKDSSVNSGADRGYIALRQMNYLDTDTQDIVLNHRQQNGTINIISDMSWRVSTSASWIDINTPNGYGNSELQFLCALNDTDANRTATITISAGNHTKLITVTQQAYTIDVPNKVNVTYGKPVTISIEAELGLEINYESDQILCEVISGSIGQNLKITKLTNSSESLEVTVLVNSGNVSKQLIVSNSNLPSFGDIECVFYAPLKNGVYRDEVSGVDPVIDPNAVITDDTDSTTISLSDNKFNSALLYRDLDLHINPEQGWTLVCWCKQNNYSGNGYSAMCACPELSECRDNSNNVLYTGECYIAGVRFTSSIATSFSQKAAVVSNKGMNMIFYNNGAVSKSYPSWGFQGYALNTPSSVAVCEIHYNNTFYDITISDVMVFNGCLTPEQLQTLQRI